MIVLLPLQEVEQLIRMLGELIRLERQLILLRRDSRLHVLYIILECIYSRHERHREQREVLTDSSERLLACTGLETWLQSIRIHTFSAGPTGGSVSRSYRSRVS